MIKKLQQKVLVQVDGKKYPQTFSWRNRLCQIEKILDSWEEAGEWWDNATSRTVYRVLTTTQETYELHFLHQPQLWILYSIDD